MYEHVCDVSPNLVTFVRVENKVGTRGLLHSLREVIIQFYQHVTTVVES
jgi:hypothetical protein